MKKLHNLTLVASLVISFQIDAQNKSKEYLIGNWEFSSLTSLAGNKVDTIWHPVVGGYELASGPELVFKSDGSYKRIFNSENIDEGRWQILEAENILINRLFLDPNIPTSQFLIKTGRAKQDKNGDYYEEIKYSIVTLEKMKLVLEEREGLREYKKKK